MKSNETGAPPGSAKYNGDVPLQNPQISTICYDAVHVSRLDTLPNTKQEGKNSSAGVISHQSVTR
jgi:hypothetical protein